MSFFFNSVDKDVSYLLYKIKFFNKLSLVHCLFIHNYEQFFVAIEPSYSGTAFSWMFFL